MKKTILLTMFLTAVLLGLGACGEKSRMDELKDFVEKVQEEGSGYTEEKWQEVNEEFSKLLDKLNEYKDLSPEELKEMAKYQAEFATAAFKQHAGKFMEDASKAMEQAGAVLEGLTEDNESQKTED